ncbi:hypothetical protein ACFL1G_04340 [Planctomycetota bacterium]
MEEITLKVEASYGCKVQVGDIVEADKEIGNAPRTGLPVKTPIAGTVKSIDFNSKEHSFVIVIS